MEEENRQLRSALRQAQHEIGELRQQVEECEMELRRTQRLLAQTRVHLRVIRNSSTWKILAPVRKIKSSMRELLGR